MDNRPQIVIIYTSPDNQSFSEGEKGWVLHFQKFLTTLLGQFLNKKPEILLKSDNDDHSVDSYQSADILIPVFSPAFIQSQVLLNGLRNFETIAKKTDSGYAGIFKVFKYPVELDELLPEINDIISYDFYQIDTLTGDVQEFNRYFGPDAERFYWMKLVDLAYDISQLLIKIYPDLGSQQVRESKQQSIYLASVGMDLVFQRDIIKRELQRHGYKVLPDQVLPGKKDALQEVVEKNLKQCHLSIHLIGKDYGKIPENGEISAIELENKIATDHSIEHQDFSRLIWLTSDIENVSERQKLFIENLRSDAESLENAEIFQIPIQELRAVIMHELESPESESTYGRYDDQPGDDEESSIYLICDKRDLKDSKTLADFLQKQGFKVISPSFEGDLIDLRHLHQENLRRCDGSIIYFGKANEEWLKTKLQDILKAPGFGRRKPIKAKAIYMGTDRQLDEMQIRDALVLGNKDKLDAEMLKPFLTKLEN